MGPKPWKSNATINCIKPRNTAPLLANIIATVDRVRALMPQLAAAIPQSVDLSVVLDRSPPIRGSLKDVEHTLIISGILVILVVFAFLRNPRATLIPGIAVPVSLISTFGVMYLLGYSLD